VNEWGEHRLGEVVSLIIDHRGRTPKKLGGEWSSSGVQVLSAKNLKSGKLDFGSEQHYVDPLLYERWMPVKLAAGDVLLTSEAPLGEAYYLKSGEQFCLGQRLFALRAKPEMLASRFLYYRLISPETQQELLARASGSTVQGIRQSELRRVPLSIPPLPTQRRIAEILGRLDDKIEVNRRINRTLEAIAQALYRHWFVDFGPFRDGEFVESELGAIPQGWEVRQLSEVATVVSGRSYKSEELKGSSVALVTLKSFERGGGYKRDGLKAYTGIFKPEQVIQPGEVVIACTDLTQQAEVIGKPALVQPDDNYSTLVASLDCLIVRSALAELTSAYLYLLFMTPDFQAYSGAHANGSTVLHLNKAAIPQYRFICPPTEVLKRFGSLVTRLFRQVAVRERENVKLVGIRDYLLPKLLTGEVAVEAAAEMIA